MGISFANFLAIALPTPEPVPHDHFYPPEVGNAGKRKEEGDGTAATVTPVPGDGVLR